MIAELIALVRQTQDQFEAHGELNACCASRKLPGFPRPIELNVPEGGACLQKGESVRLMELNRLARANLTRYLDSPPAWRGNYQRHKRFNTE